MDIVKQLEELMDREKEGDVYCVILNEAIEELLEVRGILKKLIDIIESPYKNLKEIRLKSVILSIKKYLE